MIGIALGIVATSLRVLLGVDRSYPGADSDPVRKQFRDPTIATRSWEPTKLTKVTKNQQLLRDLRGLGGSENPFRHALVGRSTRAGPMSDFITKQQWWLLVVIAASLRRSPCDSCRRASCRRSGRWDRRWIFLLMAWAVLVPICTMFVSPPAFPEFPASVAADPRRDREAPGGISIRASLALRSRPAEEELSSMATAFRETRGPEEAEDVLHGAVADRPADDRQHD